MISRRPSQGFFCVILERSEESRILPGPIQGSASPSGPISISRLRSLGLFFASSLLSVIPSAACVWCHPERSRGTPDLFPSLCQRLNIHPTPSELGLFLCHSRAKRRIPDLTWPELGFRLCQRVLILATRAHGRPAKGTRLLRWSGASTGIGSASDRIGKCEGFPNREALASYRICSPQTQKDTISDGRGDCFGPLFVGRAPVC